MAGRGPAGVEDAVVIELPADRERGGVDRRQHRPGPVGGSVDAPRRWRWRRVEDEPQQCQLLELVQPCLAVRTLIVWPERRGAHAVVAEPGEAVEPAPDLLGRWKPGAGYWQDLRGTGVAGPRSRPHRRPAGAQHDVGHAEAADESDHLHDGSVRLVALLFATHPRYLDHIVSPNHPERPQRLDAVLEGAHRTVVADALVPLEPRPATRAELERV